MRLICIWDTRNDVKSKEKWKSCQDFLDEVLLYIKNFDDTPQELNELLITLIDIRQPVDRATKFLSRWSALEAPSGGSLPGLEYKPPPRTGFVSASKSFQGVTMK